MRTGDVWRVSAQPIPDNLDRSGVKRAFGIGQLDRANWLTVRRDEARGRSEINRHSAIVLHGAFDDRTVGDHLRVAVAVIKGLSC